MIPFDLDAVLLARVQFAFIISFHILFPSFTIGLASFLAVLEGMWLKTKHPAYKELYKFWVKIFAITFGMGVVSGVVLSYQFGTNWSGFSHKIGNVLGPLLGYEVLTAFFLEASFLGIMLFGWGRVSKSMHFLSTIIVAGGTIVSAFWILSANSWMHTPAGFHIGEGDVLYPDSWIEIIFNPSFPYRFMHMITACYLTTSFVVSGVASWYLYRNQFASQAKIMLAMGMLMAVIVAPMQLLIGDMHGLNTLEHQPAKIAAMEGIFEDEKGAALRLFGIVDQENEEIKYAIEIPKLASLILTHDINGEIKGLKNWPKNERPNVSVVFYSFRIMVASGMLMILTGVFAIILYLRGELFSSKGFQLWCMAMTPSGFIAVLAGWFVTEVGRQPYLVQGVLKTVDLASPVDAHQVLISLVIFIAVYLFVFGTGTWYILKLIYKGPIVGAWHSIYMDHGTLQHVTIADVFISHKKRKGGKKDD